MSEPSSLCRQSSRQGTLAGRPFEIIDEVIPMRLYLDSIVGLLQERSAEELIVGVFLALLLAVAGAGIYNLVRHKVKDTVVLLTVVCLIANLIAMIFTAGYVRMRIRVHNLPNPNAIMARSAFNRSQVRDLTFDATARAILQAADLDHDGKLSAAEAATVSTRFIELAEAESGKPLDWETLAMSMKKRVRVFDTNPVDREHPPVPSPGLDGQFNNPLSGGQPGPPMLPTLGPRR
jgi:hypothetical protein